MTPFRGLLLDVLAGGPWARRARRVAARRRAATHAPPTQPAQRHQAPSPEEAEQASRLRLVVQQLLVGELWRPEVRGIVYELAAQAQRQHPADWERRFTAAYTRAQEEGAFPADLPVTRAEEHAFLERLRRYLAEDPG